MSALLTDFYALTMAQSHFQHGRKDEWGVFDYFFRRIPERGGFALFAGLAPLLKELETLHFCEDDLAFLREKGVFTPEFLAYLKTFRFRGEIYSFPEGSVIFPNEPVLTVRAPLIDAQLIETLLLLTLNHQSLIATKAARICLQAQGRAVLEFGARRAHGKDAALYGARAAYIGGVAGSSNTLADNAFGVPALGTMAHAYVQSFDTEYQAFANYAQTFPDNTVLLVDTYDTLNSGIPNAIRVHHDILAPQGKRLRGIRLDSGDLAYLSQRARDMLDAQGLHDVQIIASNGLDEFLIKDLINQHAAIDVFGVGERLITARSEPVFGGVYKLSALEREGTIQPKIKISSDAVKTTTPGFKQVWRLFDEKNMAIADVITLRDEHIDTTRPYLLFDPVSPWKKKWIRHFRAQAMQQLVFSNHKSIHAPHANAANSKSPEYTDNSDSIENIRQNAANNLAHFWPEIKRLENPHLYYVDLSQALWQLKNQLITEAHKDSHHDLS